MYCIKNNSKDCEENKTKFSTSTDSFIICKSCCNGDIEQNDGCCIKPDIIFVNMPRRDGVPLKRKFCKNCGYYKQEKAKNIQEINSLPFISVNDAEKIQEKRENKKRSFRKHIEDLKKERIEDNNAEFWRQYEEYLRTDKWRNKRELVLKRDNYVCQACLTNKATQAHHKTYEHVFDEFLFELISVCKECHDLIHSKNDR